MGKRVPGKSSINRVSIISNLPVEKTRYIAEDPVKQGVLYAGTEKGVYVSLDNGDHWSSISEGLPAVSIDNLLVHPRENELVIGTYGRGIYKMDVSYIQKSTAEIMNSELYLFDIKDATLPKKRDFDGDWFFETADYPEFVFWLNSTGKVEIIIEDESGQKIRTINTEGGKGLNYFEWDLIKNHSKYPKWTSKEGCVLYQPGTYHVTVHKDTSFSVPAKSFELKEY